MNLLVYCTCPDEKSASALAAALVERRLAACVSQIPAVRSTYRWEGKLCHDQEVMLLIKTTADNFAALEAQVVKLHPYEVPELIAMPIKRGHQPYLDWLVASTQDPISS